MGVFYTGVSSMLVLLVVVLQFVSRLIRFDTWRMGGKFQRVCIFIASLSLFLGTLEYPSYIVEVTSIRRDATLYSQTMLFY